MKLKALVVDDTIVFRKVVGDALSQIPDVEVVATAPNGKIALSRIAQHHPDIMTLDIEMPEMNGIEVLENLRKQDLEIGVIVLSAHTVKGGELTIKALELGAFDFVTKPSGAGMDQNRDALVKTLGPMVKAYARRREIKSILKGKSGAPLPTPSSAPSAAARPAPAAKPGELDDIARRMAQIVTKRPDMILIGVSTGGPNALAQMLPKIPGDLGVPVLIVQHMPPIFTQSLAQSLNAKCALEVKEAEEAERIKPNVVYIAPGGRQMKLIPGTGDDKLIRITDDPPENNCKPSVDYLFRSVANSYPGKAMAVILTGMGNDGTLGMRLLKRHGCFTVAQDEASCVVFGMPREAIAAGVVDVVTPLDNVAGEIVKAVKGYSS